MGAILLTHPPEQEQLKYISKNNFEKLLIGERTPFLKYYLQNSFLEDNVLSLIQLGTTKSPANGILIGITLRKPLKRAKGEAKSHSFFVNERE
jgi:hypothetical protein